MDPTSGQARLPGSPPSYNDWFEEQWQRIETDDVPKSAPLRGRMIGLETPVHLLPDAMVAKATLAARSRLRRDGAKSVPAPGGGTEYLPPDQLELWQVVGFLQVNSGRRDADVKEEVRFVDEWCGSHSEYTRERVYEEAGLAPPLS